MNRYLSIIFAAIIFCISIAPAGSANDTIIREDFSKYFNGYTGTFVLYNENSQQYIIYNEPMSKERLSPCSTFKIFNSLIGLESGVLEKEDSRTLMKWNGQTYSIPSWNRDHTLSTAITNSVVWYYQQLARDIGNERMQNYITKLNYGNQDISGGIDRFWLSSSLKISAQEQVALLRQLYNNDLPFSAENMAITRKIIVLSTDNESIFSGKTGTAYGNILGWFVGCVEKDGNKYFFATNIQGEHGASGPKAREISKLILTDLGIL